MFKGISGVIIVVIGLLAVSGCGGGSSSLSKAEYEQQLELVCNKGLQEREAFLAKVSEEFAQEQKGQTSPAEQAKNIRGFMAVYKGITEKIEEIGLPEQDEEKAEELLQAREDAAEKIEADPVGTFPNSLQIFARANKIAEDLEVHSCAK